MSQQPIWGTPPAMLAPTGGAATSTSAANVVPTTVLEKQVWLFVQSQGTQGATAYECIKHFNPVSDSTIHARPSSLERKGLIYYKGDTRKGGTGRMQRIMRVTPYTQPEGIE
jgi:hypothetical protein